MAFMLAKKSKAKRGKKSILRNGKYKGYEEHEKITNDLSKTFFSAIINTVIASCSRMLLAEKNSKRHRKNCHPALIFNSYGNFPSQRHKHTKLFYNIIPKEC